MSNARTNDEDQLSFMTGWDLRLGENEQLPVWFAIMALTNFGEKPVPSALLAQVLNQSVSEVETRARGHCTSGAPIEDGFIRVDHGLITYLNSERAKSEPRRQLQIGNARFGMMGCGFDVYLYAPLLDRSLRVEETCAVTGTQIRLTFSPERVQRVEPDDAVVPIPHPEEFDRLAGLTVHECDANCATSPFYSSAAAAQEWLVQHPGGRIFPIEVAWNLSFHRVWRDRMSQIKTSN